MRNGLFGRAGLCAMVVLCTSTAGAQDIPPAVDPGVMAQSALIQGTMQGHADRGYARQRGEQPRKAVSDACMRAWRRHDRMTRAEKNRLYDLCPR